MLYLWYNGQLNTSIREPSRILELQDRLKEWLQKLQADISTGQSRIRWLKTFRYLCLSVAGP
jgi:hypothetical protein